MKIKLFLNLFEEWNVLVVTSGALSDIKIRRAVSGSNERDAPE